MSELPTAKRQRVNWSAEERVDWVKMLERSGKAVWPGKSAHVPLPRDAR